MTGEELFCAACGITIRPFMKVCPRCGKERENAEPIEIPPRSPKARSDPATSVGTPSLPPPFVPGRADSPQSNLPQQPERVYLPPGETMRRFPSFTSAQRALMAIGIGLLVMMMVIAYLLWRQQKRDLIQTAAGPIKSQQPQAVAAAPSASPANTLVAPEAVDDQKISEAVKSALQAYNPLGFARYKIVVKHGVVTLKGEALHQPEKDGADNVVRLVAGVKSVVNNLKVKPEADFPPQVNASEANLLDEAMRRQIQTGEQAKEGKEVKEAGEVKDNRRGAEEAEAAQRLRQHEEEITLRKAAEEKLQRDIQGYDKRQEELRRADAERRTRAEQTRFEASMLRTGTVAWSGVIDGVDEIIFSGSSSSVRHVSGKPAREVRASFSAPLPRSPINLAMISSNGRGAIVIAQQPSPDNGYTTIVRIDDKNKGEQRYEFTLRWTLQ